MKTKSDIEKIVRGVSKSISGIRESAVANEISSVVVEIKTKDGNVLKHTILGSEVRRTLSMMQTISNCIGFPASREADFATIRSVMNNPGPLLRDYLAGKLDWFFDGNSRYTRSVFYEERMGKLYLKLPKTWKHKDKFYAVGKRKDRYDLELSICDYLHKEKEKEKQS